MLRLTRKMGEAIYIGDRRVVFIGRSKNVIRIGIDAPKDVQVHREEVYKRIEKERAGQ